MANGLTPKQESFCQKYIETGNASEAYRQSYDVENMKPETINREAFELLENHKISARVKELKQRQLTKHGVTIDRVVKEFAKLAFLDIRKAFDEEGRLKPIHDIDDDTAAAIAGIEVESLFEGRGADRQLLGNIHKLKLSDKRGALSDLARHLGMFVDRSEISGPGGGPIVTQTKEQRDAAVKAACAADS